MMAVMPFLRAPGLLVTLLVAGSACSSGGEGAGLPQVEVWAHVGQEAERAVLEAQAARYNRLQDSVEVVLEFLPEGSYHAQIQAAAVADRLPDLIDVDGPYVPSLAWQGHLRPLGDLVADPLLGDLLPSILEQGTWRDRLWALGTFDSGLGLYVDRSALDAAGLRLPASPDEAWTVEEFEAILAALAQEDPDGAVLDLKLNYDGEWFSYAFQPAIRSGGGRLLDLGADPPEAAGSLDEAATVRTLATLQRWIVGGLVDPNLDDRAFADGRVAVSWSGHWDYPGYAEALGDDLAVVPLPDFGEGTRTGQGSWMWAVPARSTRASAAVAFLSFLLRPDEVLAMTRANGAVPGTRTAGRRSATYGPGGALALLRQLESGYAVARPRSPAYPFVSSIFQDVFEVVRNGAPLEPALRDAARTVDREIRDNRGYPSS
jgi:multiple sugar transport system substrate-binding protein